MPKKCSIEGCNYNVFTKGFCKFHAPRKYPNKVSKKMGDKLKEYAKNRKEYLEEHPYCEVCGREANQIHHKAGRIGNLLADTRNFLAVCFSCHERIETNPDWAKENGYSKNRL